VNTRDAEFERAVREHATTAQYPNKVSACQKHGDFESRSILGRIWTGCPACENEIREQKAAEVAKELERQKILRWSQLLEAARIPERFRERSFENYLVQNERQGRALAFSRRLADDIAADTAAGRCAMFVGRPGTGKTHLAVAVAKQCMLSGRSALFTTVTRLIRRIRDTYNRGSAETESQAIEVFTAPNLLLLDEVGVQRGTDDEKMLLFDVLNERYESRLSTILLSNLTAQEVRAFLGERVFDRMREDGGQVVTFDWQSNRSEAAS
jgi:DNA replication protein DnaC